MTTWAWEADVSIIMDLKLQSYWGGGSRLLTLTNVRPTLGNSTRDAALRGDRRRFAATSWPISGCCSLVSRPMADTCLYNHAFHHHASKYLLHSLRATWWMTRRSYTVVSEPWRTEFGDINQSTSKKANLILVIAEDNYQLWFVFSSFSLFVVKLEEELSFISYNCDEMNKLVFWSFWLK